MQFRECVMYGGKTLSIFAFSSVKAISQYTVEEILEMGIDGFWIGYEGTRSNYAKQQGRPIEKILTEFREHGITILTSMIVGFDYQTPEVVAQEFDGLMKLKPALGQYLIYGPVPGTPFNERVRKEKLMREEYVEHPDRLYRIADGFTTVMKHPTLSAAEIEGLQRWCFEQDYQRLGPSIFRVLESRLLGWQRLRNSPNPHLRRKAEVYAADLRFAYPVFLAGMLLGPNPTVRGWIRDLQRRIHADLGQPTFAQGCKSVMAVGAALWTGLTLKLDLFQHPRLTRTPYRVPSARWSQFQLWEEIPQSVSIPNFSIRIDLQHAKEQVWLRLEGALSAAHARDLGQRIHDSLQRSKSKLILDLQNLHWDKVEDLTPLREKLAAYRSRIRLVLPRLASAPYELTLLAGMFQHYRG